MRISALLLAGSLLAPVSAQQRSMTLVCNGTTSAMTAADNGTRDPITGLRMRVDLAARTITLNAFRAAMEQVDESVIQFHANSPPSVAGMTGNLSIMRSLDRATGAADIMLLNGNPAENAVWTLTCK